MSETIFEQKAQDLVNNNHIAELEAKIKPLSIQSEASVDLFDAAIFRAIKSSEFKFQYDKFELSAEANSVDLGDGVVLRPLRRDDFSRGYMKLLSQLTEVGTVTKEVFEKRFDQMRASENTYYICVVEDTNRGQLVATLTLVYEQKFIRQASARGRFEDLVVDEASRGKKLSKLLLDVVVQLSKALGCYKISLECKDHLRKHYEQFGFVAEPGQNFLCQRL
jgi:glucosamine-phosphate N-acetyltransferase